MSKNLTPSYNKVIYQIQTKRAAYTMRNAQVEVRETQAGAITIEQGPPTGAASTLLRTPC